MCAKIRISYSSLISISSTSFIISSNITVVIIIIVFVDDDVIIPPLLVTILNVDLLYNLLCVSLLCCEKRSLLPADEAAAAEGRTLHNKKDGDLLVWVCAV